MTTTNKQEISLSNALSIQAGILRVLDEQGVKTALLQPIVSKNIRNRNKTIVDDLQAGTKSAYVSGHTLAHTILLCVLEYAKFGIDMSCSEGLRAVAEDVASLTVNRGYKDVQLEGVWMEWEHLSVEAGDEDNWQEKYFGELWHKIQECLQSKIVPANA